jgi:galactonate dehydratase
VFLELSTDDGLVGVSEVRMVNKTDTLVACIGELAPRYVIGADPFDVERLAWNVQRPNTGGRAR